MTKTIAVFGAGPGFGGAVARRFGREGFRVALVARTQPKLDRMVTDLAGEGIEAAGFATDLADRSKLGPTVRAIVERFSDPDVVHYAPAAPDLVRQQVDIRAADPASFEFGLELLLRTPAELIALLLPRMLERGDGAVLFGLGGPAGVPFPQVGNVVVVAAAARSYLQNLHASLADTGVYAGLVQVAGMIGGSESAEYFARQFDPSLLPEPLDPMLPADAAWDLYTNRDRFETMIGA